MKTFIFGAGASIPFFEPILSTDYLTKKVCDENQWDRIMEIYKKQNGKSHLMIPSKDVMCVINRILSIQKTANFEQIAEIIDKISSFGYDSFPTDNMMNLLISIMNEGFDPKNKPPFGVGWSDIPFLYREIIAEVILDLQRDHKVKDYASLSKLQTNFIKSVCDKDDEVSIVDFNYDDCVYDSLDGLGFKTGFSNRKKQIDINEFMHADKVIYFPHGHLKFQFTDNDNVTFWSDSNTANDERWESIDGINVNSTITKLRGKFAYNYNTFIATGQTKDEGLNHQPYSVYYQRLAIDLFRSDKVYVIGYSFGDDHVNRLLRSFLELSPANRVFIIDYYPGEITMMDEYQDSNNIISKVYYNLGTDWLFTSSNGDLSPKYPDEITKMNRSGFGELFPRVFFYKKGYSEFLKDFSKYESVLFKRIACEQSK